MNAFPESLKVSNKKKFATIKYTNTIRLLRECIYKHMLNYTYNDDGLSSNPTENNSFDLEVFFKSNNVTNDSDKDNIFNIIKKELQELGWNCVLTFGGTTLFIYSSESFPTSCWTNEF
jgi:hypothetical protein